MLKLTTYKKYYTLLKWLLNKKTYDSGGEGLFVWIAYGFNFHNMTPKSLEINHAWVSTAHFCKVYEN